MLGISRRSCPYSWTQGRKTQTLRTVFRAHLGCSARVDGRLSPSSRYADRSFSVSSLIALYAGAGEGESVNGVFAGHRLIVCDGHVLAEGQPFTTGLTTAVIPEKVLSELATKANLPAERSRDDVWIKLKKYTSDSLPDEKRARRTFFFRETLTIQGQGRSRLAAIRTRPVLGLSGGPTALALLRVFGSGEDRRLRRRHHRRFTPGPGTSERSRQLARQLGEATQSIFARSISRTRRLPSK